MQAGFAQKVNGSCVFCATSRPLLSIAAAGSPVVGAEASSTTSSCDEEDVELDEVDVVGETEDEELVVETDVEGAELDVVVDCAVVAVVTEAEDDVVGVDVVDDFGMAKYAPTAAMIIITITTTTIAERETAVIVLLLLLNSIRSKPRCCDLFIL